MSRAFESHRSENTPKKGRLAAIAHQGGTPAWNARFDHLIRTVVAPAVFSTNDCRIVDQIKKNHGKSIHVRFIAPLDDQAGDWRVVRGFFRVWNPLRPGGRFARFEQTSKTSAKILDAGIRAPRTLSVHKGVRPSRFLQYLLLVEEYIDGRELSWKDPEQAVAAMRTLARLHNLRSASWNTAGKGGQPAETFVQKMFLRRTERLVSGRRSSLEQSESNELLGMVRAAAEQAQRQSPARPFSLIHGDFRSSNLLVADDGDLVLIDFMHTRFGLFLFEFFDVMIHARRHGANPQRLAEAYFAQLDAELAEMVPQWWKAVFLQRHLEAGAQTKASLLRSRFNMQHARAYAENLAPGRVDQDWEAAIGQVERIEFLIPPDKADE